VCFVQLRIAVFAFMRETLFAFSCAASGGTKLPPGELQPECPVDTTASDIRLHPGTDRGGTTVTSAVDLMRGYGVSLPPSQASPALIQSILCRANKSVWRQPARAIDVDATCK
jgi:hypothetical protein